MSDIYSKSWGYVDPAAATVSVLPLDKANFTRKSLKDNESVITNVTTPVDQPETIRFGIQNVSNVYAGTDVDPVNRPASLKGKSIVVGVRDILRVTNSTTAEHVDYPMKANMAFSFPISANISAEDVAHCLKRNAGILLAAAGDVDAINKLMRGSIDVLAA